MRKVSEDVKKLLEDILNFERTQYTEGSSYYDRYEKMAEKYKRVLDKL